MVLDIAKPGWWNRRGGQLGVSMEYVKQLNVVMDNISSSSGEIGKIIAAVGGGKPCGTLIPGPHQC